MTKNPNVQNLKIKYQQVGVKLECLIDKEAILHRKLFSVTLHNTVILLERIFIYFKNGNVFKNGNRINYSSPMNNTVKEKIDHFPQLFALGTQVALKSN